MKKNPIIALFALLIVNQICIAQTKIPIKSRSNQPVLIDDTHSQSVNLAKESFEKRPTSLTPVWKHLSEKQKTKILQIEESRNRALSKIEMQIESKNGYLKTLDLFTKTDIKLVEKTKSEISKLVLDKKKLLTKSKNKIRAQLTATQRAILDNK